jgi:hypothetical protein
MEHSTRNAFIGTAIAVGVATCLIVFNLDVLSSKYKGIYHKRRDAIVEQMINENSPPWKKMGEQFFEFKPTSENKVPSEWWIIIYPIRNFFTSGWNRKKKTGSDEESTHHI